MDKDLIQVLKGLDESRLPDFVEQLPAIERQILLNTLKEYEGVLEREKGQEDFLSYVKTVWPAFIPGRHHSIIASKFEEIAEGKQKRLIICLPPRHALLTSTKIPTPDGWKRISALQVGDHVFGPDGKPTKVIGKSEVFKNKTLYRVITDDGAFLDVDGEHLWTVGNVTKPLEVTMTTEELYKRQQSGKVSKPRLPYVEPVEYPKRRLPIDPYVLGVFLGDHHPLYGSIRHKLKDAPYIRKEILRRKYKIETQIRFHTYHLERFKPHIAKLQVMRRKHIPPAYLTASVEQRKDLLMGLIDNRSVVNHKGQIFIGQTQKQMVLDLCQLLSSLGIKPHVYKIKVNKPNKDYGELWRIMFYAPGLTKIPRKLERMREPDKIGRYIRVEKLHTTGDVQCIKVDRRDGLFLAGEEYICTHNTKSEFASYLLPAWYLGRYPNKKIIQCSNTAELAVGFGRKVRNLVDSDLYAKVFPEVKLRQDSKAAGRWSTNANGEYFAIGVGGTVTGKGADLLIIDDPHSEQEAALAAHDPKVYDKVYEWYTSGPRQRLQPGGAIIVVMTRWGKRDLVGQVLKAAAQRGGEDWEVVEFPAIMPSGKPVWPEFWSLKELEALREELPNSKWQAQYQQNPVSEEAAVIKREWWQRWEDEDPPSCEFVLQAWDTAFEKHQRADYSACTTWGVFYQADDRGETQANIILLNAVRDKLEFPELKKMVMEQYKEWDPDSVIIEKRASGAPLIYELRAMNVMVQEFTPAKGNDKISRLNAVSDIFASGRVWAPNTSWAEEVIDEVAGFPNSEHDDYVDTVSLALMRFRRGGYIRTAMDEDDETSYNRRRPAYY
jgi:predicted phage terminase large subunit-like protein